LRNVALDYFIKKMKTEELLKQALEQLKSMSSSEVLLRSKQAGITFPVNHPARQNSTDDFNSYLFEKHTNNPK
jgi:hypothetical protein